MDLAMERFGRIDIFVQNAGINPALGDILDVDQIKLVSPQGLIWLSLQFQDRIFEINVKCSFLLCKLVAPYMELNG
jgi:dehydrogenase/reductase SDR family protein 4